MPPKRRCTQGPSAPAVGGVRRVNLLFQQDAEHLFGGPGSPGDSGVSADSTSSAGSSEERGWLVQLQGRPVLSCVQVPMSDRARPCPRRWISVSVRTGTELGPGGSAAPVER
jgi:hypothetical protein